MCQKKFPTRAQQRQSASRRIMAAATLELQLHQLVQDALRGDLQAAQEFQQAIQYAPEATRMRIQELIDLGGRRG